ncbi:hypothetical protein ACMFMG_003360 [Clarireedia jacksonii]
MRLFLLPVSTRRTLIYCQRLNVVTTTNDASLLDKATRRASNLWAGWEKKESGWQRKVVDLGNKAFKRIPYEEWGLKSIPPLSTRRETEGLGNKTQVDVLFPSTILPQDSVVEVLRTLATERQKLHKSRMIYSIVGLPIAAPFGLIPLIPNLPFFYLCFRAYSHWKALKGSQHIEFLLKEQLIRKQPSKILDQLYARQMLPKSRSPPLMDPKSVSSKPSNVERMLLQQSDASRIASSLNIPELQLELERAVWQVERDLQAKKDLRDEKERLDSANSRDRTETKTKIKPKPKPKTKIKIK